MDDGANRNNMAENDDAQSVESFHTAVEEMPPRGRYGQCFGSSSIWIIFCFALMVIFILVVYVTQANMASRNAPYIYLILLMSFSGIGQLYCLCKRDNADVIAQNVPSGNRVTDLYVMAGLYMFGTGTLLSILLEISLYIHSSFLLYDCYEYRELKTNIDANLPFQNNQNSSAPLYAYGGYCYTVVAYNAFRFIFVFIQLSFIHSLRHSHFIYSSWVKLFLYQTSLTNVCIWFKYVSDETGLFGEKEAVFSGLDSFMLTAESFKHRLNPFILEFSLIAAGIFVNISSNMRIPQNDADIGDVCDVAEENDLNRYARGGDDYAGTQPGLLLGACCGLMLVPLAIMFDNSNSKLSEVSKAVFLCYESFLSIFQWIAILIAVHYVLRDHRVEDYHQNIYDYVLLAAAYLGTLAFDFVVFYGVSISIANHSNFTFENSTQQNPYQRRDDILVTALTICLSISHATQMVAIVACFRKYGPRFELKSAGYIRQCILFLIATNLGSWALDSFVEIRNHVIAPYYSAYMSFRGWQTVIGLSFPFCVFFRFHSALLLFEFWQRFKFG